MKESHDQGICCAEGRTEEDSDNEVYDDRECVDHVHLVVSLRAEILCNNNACSCCDNVEEDIHHEHDGICVADCTYGIFVVVAQHQRVNIVDHCVQEEFEEHRPRQ